MLNTHEEELVFLEWLKNEYNKDGKLPKIDVMPLGVFEEYVRRFCIQKSKGKKVQNKIIESFKGEGFSEFHECYDVLAFPMNEEQKRNFKFVSERYLSNGSIYKCLIFPLEEKYSKFEEFIEEWWSDLDNLSANYLDIYYIFEDYGYCGTKLMMEFESLDQKFHTKVPCIAIWKDNIDKAKVVSIRRLSADDVFDVINEIVSLIRESKTLKQIVKGANKKVMQLKGVKEESSVKTFFSTFGRWVIAIIGALAGLVAIIEHFGFKK